MQETQEMQVQSLGQEDPLEEEMATFSSILAWKTPWTEEPEGLQSMGLQRVRHNQATNNNSTHDLRVCIRFHQIWPVLRHSWDSLVAQTVKRLPAMREPLVRSPGREDPREGNGTPLQYSCLENSMDRGDGWASLWGWEESDVIDHGSTKLLSSRKDGCQRCIIGLFFPCHHKPFLLFVVTMLWSWP